MSSNPFLSSTYSSIWFKHFYKSKKGCSFKFIEGPSFFKLSLFPVYINIGKNLTKGISYKTVDIKTDECKKKVFIIYDIPQYFESNISTHPENMRLLKAKQYPGFLINLEAYENLNDYMTSTFSKSSRYKLNKYKKRFEISFDITYKMFFGEISKTEYDWLFEQFKQLLQKRFSEKQTINNNLNPKEWDFYHEVAYPMILEKQASLFVIYDGRKPIGITLNYFSDNVLFDAITVFDVDYAKFHVGSVTIMKLIEWCLQNNFKVHDFSKGYFDYKTRWANKVYDFEYHIWYDSKSLSASFLAFIIKIYFGLKQTFREININEMHHKIIFWIKNKKDGTPDEISKFKFIGPVKISDSTKLDIVPLNDEKNRYLKPMVFEFLYLNSETLKDISLYKINGTTNTYIITGKNISQEVHIG